MFDVVAGETENASEWGMENGETGKRAYIQIKTLITLNPLQLHKPFQPLQPLSNSKNP